MLQGVGRNLYESNFLTSLSLRPRDDMSITFVSYVDGDPVPFVSKEWKTDADLENLTTTLPEGSEPPCRGGQLAGLN